MKRRMIFITIVAVVLLGAAGFLYLSPMHSQRPGTNRDALGVVDTADSLGTADNEGQNTDAGKAYIVQFYRDLNAGDYDDAIVRRNITEKAKEILIEANEFDVAEGDGLATYVLFNDGTVDMGELRSVDAVRIAANTYRVTLEYDFSMNGSLCRYSLTIGLASDGDGFKIDTISDWGGKLVNIIDGLDSPDDFVSRYIDEMNLLSSRNFEGDIEFTEYALVDVDHDGLAEILARTPDIFAAFAVGSGKPELLVLFDERGYYYFYERAVGFQSSCGIGCSMLSYAVLKDSKPVRTIRANEEYDPQGNIVPEDCEYVIDGKESTAAEADKFLAPDGPMGRSVDLEPYWMEIPGVG